MLLRVISEPAIFLGHGRVYQVDAEFRSGERLALPLSSNGVSGDGVFGATEAGALPLPHEPVSGFNDVGGWFSLAEKRDGMLHALQAAGDRQAAPLLIPS